MKPLLRWIAYFIGALLVLSVIFSIAVMILIDPNDYKEDIATAVAEETGRAFSIEGDLALKTFPCCGIRLGPLALGNPPGFPEGDFASVETAAVSLQLWPLIVSQELRVGDVELTGFDVRLISRADGTNNWGFGTAADAPVAVEEETAAPGGGLADLNISGIAISNGRLSYLDEAVGDPIVISDINFSTSAIVASEPFDLEASLTADGLAPGVSASVNIEARGLIDAALPALDLSDLRGEIAVAGDDLPGGSARLNLGLGAARGLGTAHVPLEGLSAAIELAGLNLNISGGGALVDNNPDLAGTIAIQRFSPRQLLATLGEPPIVTADPAVLEQVELQADWSFAGDQAALENITMLLDDSQIGGALRVESLATQALAVDLQLDDIDVDRYLPPPTDAPDAPAAAAETSATTGDESLDLPVEALRALQLQGRIGIGHLKIAGAHLNNVAIQLAAQDGLLRLNPLTAQLYGGGYAGDVRLDVRGATPKLSVNEKLDGVDAGELLADTNDMENLSGQTSAIIKANASGNSVNELLGNLSGNASIEMQKGIYKGVDIWYEIRKARAKIKGEEPPVAPENPYTDINQFSGSTKFADGQIRNDDLLAQIPFMRLAGKGDVDLLQSTMNYRLDARVVGTPRFEDGLVLDDLEGLVLPITLTGNMDAPDVSVDVGELATSIAQRKLQDRLKDKLGIGGATESTGSTESTDGAEQQEDEPQDKAKDTPRDLLKKSLGGLFGK